MLEAMAGSRSQGEAAARLGITRRHLSRLLRETRETPCLNGTPETAYGGETRSDSALLTYGRSAPTFNRVSTTAAMTENPKLTIELPRNLKDWLERKALDRKQRDGGRFSVAPLVRELLEREMNAEKKGGTE